MAYEPFTGYRRRVSIHNCPECVPFHQFKPQGQNAPGSMTPEMAIQNLQDDLKANMEYNKIRVQAVRDGRVTNGTSIDQQVRAKIPRFGPGSGPIVEGPMSNAGVPMYHCSTCGTLFMLLSDVRDSALVADPSVQGDFNTSATLRNRCVDMFRHAYNMLPYSKADLYCFEDWMVMVKLGSYPQSGES